MFLVCPPLQEMSSCAFPALLRCPFFSCRCRVLLEVALCSARVGGHPGSAPIVSRRRCWGRSGTAGRSAAPKDPGTWTGTVNGWRWKRPMEVGTFQDWGLAISSAWLRNYMFTTPAINLYAWVMIHPDMSQCCAVLVPYLMFRRRGPKAAPRAHMGRPVWAASNHFTATSPETSDSSQGERQKRVNYLK